MKKVLSVLVVLTMVFALIACAGAATAAPAAGALEANDDVAADELETGLGIAGISAGLDVVESQDGLGGLDSFDGAEGMEGMEGMEGVEGVEGVAGVEGVEGFSDNGISVVLDGKALEFDVPPQMQNDRVLVPLRVIFEGLGADVEWDGDTETVTAEKEGTVIILTIGGAEPTVNGEIVEIDQPAILVGNRTLVPIRFVSEAFGCDVDWVDETQTVVISTEAGAPSEGGAAVEAEAPAGLEAPADVEAPVEVEAPAGAEAPVEGDAPAAKLLYQGHGSYRITSAGGVVIYVDPYAGEGYDTPADIILVTHQHGDHNQIDLAAKKDDCVIIQNMEALAGGEYKTFDVKGIKIEAVQAYNDNHDVNKCVGYIITVDGVTVYAAGDTSRTDDMATFAERQLDYVLLPTDGIYNMSAKEAAECAALIAGKHNIPIHTKPGVLFDMEVAQQFDAPGRLIVEPGDVVTLTPAT